MAAGQQTSVSNTIPAGVAGLIADASYHKNVRSYAQAEATAEVPFGVMLGQGTNDGDAKLLAAITDKLIGVVVRSQAYAQDLEIGTIGLKPGATLGVMTHGTIWVPVEEAVNKDSAVHVRAVAAGAQQAGAFRASADGVTTVNVSKFCRFVSSTAGAGLAQLEIDITNRAA